MPPADPTFGWRSARPVTPSRSRPAFVASRASKPGVAWLRLSACWPPSCSSLTAYGTSLSAGTCLHGSARPQAQSWRRSGARTSALPELGDARSSSSIPCILGCHVYCSPRVMEVVTTTTGGTAMLEKVFYTSVLVSDQDNALDFYTNVLGLEKRVENPTPDGPRFLTVGVKGDDFQLVLWPGTPGQAEPAMGRPQRRSRSRPTIAERRSRSCSRAGSSSSRTCSSSLGLRRAVPRPRRQSATDTRGPLAPESGPGLARRSRLALLRLSTSGSAGAPAHIGVHRALTTLVTGDGFVADVRSLGGGAPQHLDDEEG